MLIPRRRGLKLFVTSALVLTTPLLFLELLNRATSSGGLVEKRLWVRSWAFQLQDAETVVVAQSGFDLVVIDYSRDGGSGGEYTREEIEIIKSSGVIPLAYLSIGEAEDYRFYWREEWSRNPPQWLGQENPEWRGNYAVKFWDGEWRAIVKSYLDRIIRQGFSGVYLDKVDIYQYWADENNGEGFLIPEADSAARMALFIKEIAEYARSRASDFLIIPQNGEAVLEHAPWLLDIVSGWGAEDLFYNGTERWGEKDAAWIAEKRLRFLDRVVSTGKPVLSVDYVDDGAGYQGANKERIDDYRRRATARGYIPYAALSDRSLDRLNIIKGIQPPSS